MSVGRISRRSWDLNSFFEPVYLVGLRAFAALDDVELDLIALFEALIAIALNGTVVNEDIGSAVTAEEAVTLCVVEPLYCAFILCHLSQLPFAEMERRVVATYLNLTQELGVEFSEKTLPFR